MFSFSDDVILLPLPLIGLLDWNSFLVCHVLYWILCSILVGSACCCLYLLCSSFSGAMELRIFQ